MIFDEIPICKKKKIIGKGIYGYLSICHQTTKSIHKFGSLVLTTTHHVYKPREEFCVNYLFQAVSIAKHFTYQVWFSNKPLQVGFLPNPSIHGLLIYFKNLQLDCSPAFLNSDDFVRSNEIVITKWPIY